MEKVLFAEYKVARQKSCKDGCYKIIIGKELMVFKICLESVLLIEEKHVMHRLIQMIKKWGTGKFLIAEIYRAHQTSKHFL